MVEAGIPSHNSNSALVPGNPPVMSSGEKRQRPMNSSLGGQAYNESGGADQTSPNQKYQDNLRNDLYMSANEEEELVGQHRAQSQGQAHQNVKLSQQQRNNARNSPPKSKVEGERAQRYYDATERNKTDDLDQSQQISELRITQRQFQQQISELKNMIAPSQTQPKVVQTFDKVDQAVQTKGLCQCLPLSRPSYLIASQIQSPAKFKVSNASQKRQIGLPPRPSRNIGTQQEQYKQLARSTVTQDEAEEFFEEGYGLNSYEQEQRNYQTLDVNTANPLQLDSGRDTEIAILKEKFNQLQKQLSTFKLAQRATIRKKPPKYEKLQKLQQLTEIQQAREDVIPQLRTKIPKKKKTKVQIPHIPSHSLKQSYISTELIPPRQNYRKLSQTKSDQELELVQERFQKIKFREFSNNTRLNIKNFNYSEQKQKRDRAMQYWKNSVAPQYLPPIDRRKKQELQQRIQKISSNSPNHHVNTSQHWASPKAILRVNHSNDMDSFTMPLLPSPPDMPKSAIEGAQREFRTLSLNEFVRMADDEVSNIRDD